MVFTDNEDKSYLLDMFPVVLNVYGRDSFKWEILEYCDISILPRKELEYIEKYVKEVGVSMMYNEYFDIQGVYPPMYYNGSTSEEGFIRDMTYENRYYKDTRED